GKKRVSRTFVFCSLVILLSAAKSKKPYEKNKLVTWRLGCELGIVIDSDCPVDGGWSTWTAWSACLGLCDETGHRRRTRACVNPPTSKDGLPCSGPEQEIEPCFLTNCTIADFRKIIKNDPVRMIGLRQLEAVPVLLDQCLIRECPYEAIEAALTTDNTWQLSAEPLWNALQCVKRNLGCPVTGQWGNWGPWSACGALCGKGLQWRYRKCDSPSPSDARLVCSGAPLQYEECEGDQCAIVEPSLEYSTGGTWSEWGQWSDCSEHCGIGIRRRKRQCFQKHTSMSSFVWGTFCRGQYDQLEVCSNKNCKLNGGWSGWGGWGPCSQSCGAGKRSRSRSCTRPIPFGGGAKCFGSRTEVGPCHLNPCNVYFHNIALFNGDSVLQYNFPRKHSTFFHFYMRFLPLSPTGTLLRKGPLNNPLVRLNMHKWHVCLDVSGSSKSCFIPRLCSPTAIDPAAWHSVLVTLTNDIAMLRIDDAQVPIKGSFSCDPELERNNVKMFVGNRFHGAVQEMMLNFIPLSMLIEKERQTQKSNFFPSFASNMAYDRANFDEAFINLENDYYLRVPCFSTSKDSWRLDLTLKPNTDTGMILFMLDSTNDYWILLSLQNLRLKIKLNLGERKPEILSSSECVPHQWLDLSLTKKTAANIIEATINAGEKLHILLADDRCKRTEDINLDSEKSFYLNSTIYEEVCNSGDETNLTKCEKKSRTQINCNEEFYIGGCPHYIKSKIPEDIPSFSGIIASLKINNELLDLRDYSIERNKGKLLQLSSRTASVSGSYHELMWGKSNKLNLTCLYSKKISTSKEVSYWLFLDTDVNEIIRDKNITSLDDGRLLRLTLEADNELRGFYTCRSFYNTRTRNIITYGVIGKFKNDLTGPDLTTITAVFTTVSLIIFTLVWLTIEGIHDLRDGYGFFRDAHMSPEKEAEAVCKYIDQNKHLLGSKSAVRLAKARAKRKARHLASQISFAAQEPDGLMEINNDEFSAVDEGTATEPEVLPALPDAKSPAPEPSHEVFRCEPSYVSSPKHGSNITSPGTKITSSSSLDSSPRHLCSRLLMSKVKYSSKESLRSKRVLRNKNLSNRSQLLTIKSSTYVNLSPGQRILQKFKELKSMDD
ncbi:uncharacterized protein LOC119835792, partial [Zerene cesonia]|uniref:uncharacterized protein LOC119835792 n=1 Tax=Zerene cesonia TaxID=33412 RepID=UPI0018E509BA